MSGYNAISYSMKIIARFLFASLMIFELFNWLKIFNFSLDFSWLGLVITTGAIWLVLELAGDLPGYIWIIALVGVFLDAASDIFNLYSRFSYWDRLVHFMGGVLAARVLLYFALRLEEKGELKLGNKFLLPAVILGVCFLGFLYEYEEFLIDKLYFGYPKALGDGVDTVDDIFMNLVGAAAVSVYYYLNQTLRWKRFS